MGDKWDVYDAPDDGVQPETRAAAGDPLPTAVQEVGGRRRPWPLVGALIAMALLVGVLMGMLHSRDSGSPGSSGSDERPVPYAAVIPASDFTGLVTALRARAGTTVVEELAAYDDFYEVVVPAAPGQPRSRQYYWRPSEGLRDAGDAADLGPRETFDLAKLDLAPIERLYDKAWHDVPGGAVTGHSMTIAPPPSPGDSWISLFLHVPGKAFYAVDGDLDGTIVNERKVEDS